MSSLARALDGVVGAAEIGVTLAGAPALRHWFNHWGATPGEATTTWQWQLRPLTPARTRLVVRQRMTYPPGLSVRWHVIEPVAFVMEHRMMLGIKQRAEQAPSHAA